ncbi:MAG: PEP-CTERM sorting domain-containing protein [Leptolyngbyaceae cyanobacterium SM1_1_3]|nr:PEP-CTERM sorting domain-containing protein [Leptolyngbyaceae cyanobacterium SM1_1_3]
MVPEPGTLPALVALGTVLLGYQIVKRRSTQGKSARSV